MDNIRLLVGLGNPGPDYERTRHNAGYWWVDAIVQARKGRWAKESKFHGWVAKVNEGEREFRVLKPATYMNESGRSVGSFLRFHRIEPREMLVIHDELDLAPGVVKLKLGGGTGGHNGLESIIVQLGTEEIPRLRVGIGAAPREGAVDYVLGRFFEEERPLVEKSIARAADAVKCAIDNGLLSAMNQFNKNPEPDRPESGPKES